MSNKNIFILGVGGQKCGTSWLSEYINSFSNVNPGITKEYHIWDAIHVLKCKSFRVSESKRKRSSNKRQIYAMQQNEAAYFDYFLELLEKPGTNITADITPSYSALDTEIFAKIFEGFQKRNVECKVIFLMRDPFERCWSTVRMDRKRGKSRWGVSLKVDEETSLLRYAKTAHAQIRTRYDKTIANLEKSIPATNLHLAIYEELMTETGIAALSEFIGVPPKPNFAKTKVNVTPKTHPISKETISNVVKEYSDVYDYCGERFPQTRSLWAGFNYL